MIKFITICLLISAIYCQSIAISQNFNAEYINKKENSIKFNITNNGNQTLEFFMVHSLISTAGVESIIYLKKNLANDYIINFNPTKKSNSTDTTFTISIPLTQFDNTGEYPCARAEDDRFTNTTCSGFLSFLLSSNLKQDRALDFNTSAENSLLKYEFTFLVITDRKTEGGISTSIQSKIKDLPCLDCGCNSECSALQGFTATINIKDDYEYKIDKIGSKYTYGDSIYLEILLNPPTRIFDITQWYAASGNSSQYETLENKYLTNMTKVMGKVLVTVPAAGPSSLSGTTFKLKFVLLARPLSFLRNRFLQTSKQEAISIDVGGFTRSNSAPAPAPVSPSKNFSPSLSFISIGVYSLIALIFFFNY